MKKIISLTFLAIAITSSAQAQGYNASPTYQTPSVSEYPLNNPNVRAAPPVTTKPHIKMGKDTLIVGDSKNASADKTDPEILLKMMTDPAIVMSRQATTAYLFHRLCRGSSGYEFDKLKHNFRIAGVGIQQGPYKNIYGIGYNEYPNYQRFDLSLAKAIFDKKGGCKSPQLSQIIDNGQGAAYKLALETYKYKKSEDYRPIPHN